MYRASATERILWALRRGVQRVVLKTECFLGTHRSVAAAEVIARRLVRIGVRVHVRHPHRRWRAGDAW